MHPCKKVCARRFQVTKICNSRTLGPIELMTSHNTAEVGLGVRFALKQVSRGLSPLAFFRKLAFE